MAIGGIFARGTCSLYRQNREKKGKGKKEKKRKEKNQVFLVMLFAASGSTTQRPETNNELVIWFPSAWSLLIFALSRRARLTAS